MTGCRPSSAPTWPANCFEIQAPSGALLFWPVGSKRQRRNLPRVLRHSGALTVEGHGLRVATFGRLSLAVRPGVNRTAALPGRLPTPWGNGYPKGLQSPFISGSKSGAGCPIASECGPRMDSMSTLFSTEVIEAVAAGLTVTMIAMLHLNRSGPGACPWVPRMATFDHAALSRVGHNRLDRRRSDRCHSRGVRHCRAGCPLPVVETALWGREG